MHPTIQRSFRFLTPAFVHGAFQDKTNNIPELRAPSVRGQLRWWWRTLGYGLGDEIFGSASGSSGDASLVQVRLSAPRELAEVTAEILPHKPNPAHRGPKNALSAAVDLFTVELRPVRAGITAGQAENLRTTLDSWLLMGAIGQRANRSAGSVWPAETPPASPDAYLSHCRKLLADSCAKIALLPESFENYQDVRTFSGRFLGGSKIDVPGDVFGSATPRKSSSLKLRAVFFENSYRIAALWIPKTPGDTPGNLRAALMKMKDTAAKAGLAASLESVLPEFFGATDPVTDLLAATFTFNSIALYEKQVRKWRAEGRNDLLAKFRAETKDRKYAGIHSRDWYPGDK